MEPVSGAFQNWDDNGHYNPPETGWHAEMYEPGFGGETISITESGNALRWLAERVDDDPRFARSTVEQVFHAFTGLDVLKGYEWSTDSVEYEAWRQQDAFFNRVSNEFMNNGWDIKIPIREVLLSKFYRAVDHEDASEAELMMAGTARLLTPEELHQKILTITGYEWGDELIDDYRLLYGGIDSDDVVKTHANPMVSSERSQSEWQTQLPVKQPVPTLSYRFLNDDYFLMSKRRINPIPMKDLRFLKFKSVSNVRFNICSTEFLDKKCASTTQKFLPLTTCGWTSIQKEKH